MIARAFAYVVCAIPAAIGVWFVARYAYATSDTLTDAYSNAFLFGMIAVGAYVCPALAIAIGRRNRGAAVFFWAAALLAIAVNWSNTLGAISSRGAGIEAERAKLAKAVKDGDKRLAQIESELAKLPLVAVTPEAIAAADAAVKAAARATTAECGNGEPRQRGPNCRQRETDEQTKRETLTNLTTDKAKSDLRERLSNEAATIRKRQADAPAVKEGNTLGTALEKLMPWMDAETASTAQHGLMSLIVELLIAAFLALPELLSHPRRPIETKTRREADDPPMTATIATPRPRIVYGQVPSLSVAEYANERLRPSARARLSVDDLYLDYQGEAKRRSALALSAEQFAASFAKLCEGTGVLPLELDGGVFLSNIEFAQVRSRRLGAMARNRA